MLVTFDHKGGAFRNQGRAYDPQDGTWRDLKPLPTDVPVTVNSVVSSRIGVVVAGVTCDPARSTDDGDGLRCSPGDVRTFVLRGGTDAFVEVPSPRRASDLARPPSLASGSSEGDAFMSVDGAAYQLMDGARWEQRAGQGASGDLCPIGNALFGIVGGTATSKGTPQTEQLARLDERTQTWIPVGLPAKGSYGTLHCGDGSSAWYRVENEEPAVDASYLVTATGPPIEIGIPRDLHLGTITFDGATFAVDTSLVDPAVMPDRAVHQIQLLDTATHQLVRSTDTPSNGAVELYPLDGKVVLRVEGPERSNADNGPSLDVVTIPRSAE